MIRMASSIIVFALVAAFTHPHAQMTRQVRARRNRPPTIQSFTSSMTQIDHCPFVAGVGSCTSSGTIVTLQVMASDPDNDRLKYNYSVTAGAITGIGEIVNWDLYMTPLGTQTATVEVTDGQGGIASSVVRVDVVICGACDPPCPTLSVSCPSSVTEGELATFQATVGGEPPEKLTYHWSDSNGKPIPGQEGPELKIKAIGSPGEVIKATVEVGGIDPACSRQASCETRIEKQIR
jgi:hypothetical protein